MKKLLVLGFILCFGSSLVSASGDPVQKETKRGKSLTVTPLVEGNLTLYTHQSEVLQSTIPEDPLESYTRVHTRYYLETENPDVIIHIHSMNYKTVLLSYFTDKPELLEKIGKKGYRFNDLDKIITAYNFK